MDKRKKWRGAIELGKDVLILLLACSALWMLSSVGLFRRVNLTKPQQPQIIGQQQTVTGQADAARPLRLTATLRGGEAPERGGGRPVPKDRRYPDGDPFQRRGAGTGHQTGVGAGIGPGSRYLL